MAISYVLYYPLSYKNAEDFMETLFENKYVRNEEIMKEVYQYFYFKRPLYLIIDTIIGLMFVANIALWLSGRGINFAVLIVVPLFILIRFLIYRGAVDMLMKQDNDMYKGKPVRVQNYVTEQGIKTVIFKGINNLAYHNVKQVIKTRHLVIVCAKNDAMYVFEQDSFTKGSTGEFVAFLKEKGIKVRVSK